MTLAVAAAPSVAEECGVSRIEHPLIGQRSQIIEFAGPRPVTVVGHDHGDRELANALYRWAQAPAAETPTDDWRAGLDALLAKAEKAREHVKEDLAQLRTTLWRSEQPLYLAVETADEALDGLIERSRRFRAALTRQRCERDLTDTDEAALRDAELLFMGAPVYSYLSEPELRPRYELVGIEADQDAVDQQVRGKKAMGLGEARLARVSAERDFDQEPARKYMQRVVDKLNEAYADIGMILVEDHTTIREYLENYPVEDQQIRGAVYQYLFGYLDFLRGMKRRDIAIMRKLAAQNRPSLVFIGQEHLESLAGLLKMQCGRPLEKGEELPEPDVLKDIPEL